MNEVEKARSARNWRHVTLDRALLDWTAAHGTRWESREIIGESVECAEAGHPKDQCVPYCKAVASAWLKVEDAQAILDDALITESLDRRVTNG